MRLFLTLLLIGLFFGCSKKVTQLPPATNGGFITDTVGPVTVTQAPPVVQPPVVYPEQQRIAVPISDTVWFDFNSSVLRPEAQHVIDSIARALTGQITLWGGCSPEGSYEYNLDLGKRRAEAVQTEMQKYMTGFVDIIADSYGKTHLVDSANYPVNRRVEIYATEQK
jgi:outer membrane protein OmpA-like peptidoglycan-associated protein